MLRETGADAARIARGACGHPWIFRELLAMERGETPPEVTLAEWRAMILRHVELAVADKMGQYKLERADDAPKQRAYRENGGHHHHTLDAAGAELAAVRRGGLAFRKLAPTLHTVADIKAALDRIFPEDGSIPAEVAAEPAPRAMTADD
jgi:tRNA-dihydrouridine synthase B